MKCRVPEIVVNSGGYVHSQAVCDKNIVTANGFAILEFAKERLFFVSLLLIKQR